MAAQLTDPAADAELRRDGELWLVGYRGSVAHLRDLKGLADLAVLIARPRVDVHVLALVGAGPHDRPSGDVLDAPARAAYRRRLAELDRELAATRPGPTPSGPAGWSGNVLRSAPRWSAPPGSVAAPPTRGEHRGTGPEGGHRAESGTPSGASRPCIPSSAHIWTVSVITGTSCRYDPVDPLVWALSVPGLRAR